ncbi:hypothetical protein, partial [uncultured Ruegeria sp.]|uniref:hypothetical protein n=1 Tax=uncultured Ruegeria sp. TaxID=259304 RepID=UPI00261CA25F
VQLSLQPVRPSPRPVSAVSAAPVKGVLSTTDKDRKQKKTKTQKISQLTILYLFIKKLHKYT